MAIGEFTNAEAEESLEAARKLFNAIAPEARKDHIQEFSQVGNFIIAAQRHLRPVCGDTPNGNG